MKKLTFAFACASTLALFANPISVATFEAEGLLGKTVGAKDDTGGTNGDIYWQYIGASGSEDGSVVTAYGGENLTAPSGSLSGTPGSNYLNLSTEGGTLWRSVNANASGLGEAKAIAPEGQMYIDTMVQFTATEEDTGPQVDSADKLAIWLDADTEAGTKTLKVLANAFTFGEDGPAAQATAFALVPADGSTLAIEPGAWYRLSVKSVANVLKADAPGTIQGFQIRVDGKLMKATSGEPFAPAFGDFLDDTYKTAALTDKTVFASLQQMSDAGVPMTLTAVGFKGSGAIDDVVITEDELFAPAVPVEFTITTAEGVTASWSKTADGDFKDYAEGATAEPGTIYVKLATADGGVKIVEQTVAAGAANAFDLTSMTADWSWYLGDAVEGAYVIDNATELKSLAAKLATFGSAGITFKLGADIDMSDAGVFPCIGVPGAENITEASNAYFQGTFDGDGHTISNVTITNASKGTGLFGTICGAAKIMNLTVDTVTYENMNATKVGGGMLVGLMSGGTIENCTTKGSNGSETMPITYNASGIINRIETRLGAVTVKNCTNEASIYCVYSKIAGICSIIEMSGATGDVTFDNCVNKGAIVGVGTTANAITGKVPGVDGVAGIVAYTQKAVAGKAIKFVNCKDQGTLTGDCCGGILAKVDSGNITDMGGNQTKSTVPAIKTNANGTITGFAFATVADGVATYVDDSEAKAGADLKVMLAGKTVTLAKGESITLDMSIATATVAAADAENDEITKSGNVYTCQAKTIAVTGVELDKTTAEITVGGETLKLTATVAPENATDKTVTWATSNAEIATVDGGVVKAVAAGEVTITATAGGKSATCTVTVKAASKPYPAYIADGDKAKYDAWVSTYSVTDRVDTDKALQAAYLLNVAPTEAAAEKDMFAIKSITVDAAGNVNVVPPAKNSKGAAFNGTVEVLGATALEGPWAAKAAGHKFFKAVLK